MCSGTNTHLGSPSQSLDVGFPALGMMLAAFEEDESTFGSVDHIITQGFQAAAQTPYALIPFVLNKTSIYGQTSPTPVFVNFKAYVWQTTRSGTLHGLSSSYWPDCPCSPQHGHRCSNTFVTTCQTGCRQSALRLAPACPLLVAAARGISKDHAAPSTIVTVSTRQGTLNFCRSHRHPIPTRGTVRRTWKHQSEPWDCMLVVSHGGAWLIRKDGCIRVCPILSDNHE
jgi:hypothetical protein